jgi:hypothetical protein
MQYADEANAENAKLDNAITFFEGRDRENQAAAEQAAPVVPTLTLDPSTPKKARTTQAIEAVKAVAAMDAFKGIEVAKKDINQAAQRLVNSNGGDPYVSLTRVLEGVPEVAALAAIPAAPIPEAIPLTPAAPAAPTPEAIPPALTPGAMDLLAKVDAGGVPGFMSNNLRKILK